MSKSLAQVHGSYTDTYVSFARISGSFAGMKGSCVYIYDFFWGIYSSLAEMISTSKN